MEVGNLGLTGSVRPWRERRDEGRGREGSDHETDLTKEGPKQADPGGCSEELGREPEESRVSHTRYEGDVTCVRVDIFA